MKKLYGSVQEIKLMQLKISMKKLIRYGRLTNEAIIN